MLPHHQHTIDRVTEYFRNDPAFPALIIAGSLVKGWGRPDSDVDIMLVATDEEFRRRRESKTLTYFNNQDFCDYEGGYVDGKIIDLEFLQDVAGRGSEPARAAFMGAYLAYSEIPGLDDLLARIPVYPEAEREQKLRSFYAQVQALQWYVGEAEKRHNRYLLLRMTSDLVLFGGRLILAHNRILYPYHKWFLTALAGAPDQPAGLMDQIDALLADPCKARADAFAETVLTFTDWPTPPEGWPVRFLFDSEWTWRNGASPLADA